MSTVNINRVVISGNLTANPELRQTTTATAICKLRIASNTRRKDATGQWVDRPNYFDVTVWGAHGATCARYLAKGQPVAIDGRLQWREWTDPAGAKRQAVEIVADAVQFLSAGNSGDDTPDADNDAATYRPLDDIPF